MTNYVYCDKTANAMLNTIATSTSNAALYNNIKDYLHYTGKMWWNNLSDEAAQAIALLDFDPAVVSTLMFFSPKGGYFEDYLVIREAISDLVDTIADEVMPSLHCGYVPMPLDEEHRARYKFEVKDAVTATCCERKVKQDLSTELEGVFNLYEVHPDTRNNVKQAIISGSATVKNHRKNRDEAIKTIRKECLHELMDYLRTLSKGE